MQRCENLSLDESAKELFDPKKLQALRLSEVPEHVAIIMDGNRRWAKKRKLPASVGHWEGVERLIECVRAAAILGVKVLTVYAFSTENWQRSQAEVKAFLMLLDVYLRQQKKLMQKEGVRLRTIGDLAAFSPAVRALIEETVKATEQGQKIELVVALNYGSRDEIRRACVKMAQDAKEGLLEANAIDEALISKYLDTREWKDPELLIRTGGQLRLSNFLLWQLSYSEVQISDLLWPDFKADMLLDSILAYQQRDRRFGR